MAPVLIFPSQNWPFLSTSKMRSQLEFWGLNFFAFFMIDRRSPGPVFLFKEQRGPPCPPVRQLRSTRGGGRVVSIEPRAKGWAACTCPGAETGKRLLFKAPVRGGGAWASFFPEELEKPGLQDGLGELPYLGGELLLICQAKQMWRGDNIYFHNSKQIW